MKPIVFPRDEQAHDNIIEWWYFNGHLDGDDGRRYSFMDCLFKADARRVKLPFLKSPLKTIYFSHSVLSDVSRQKFYPVIDYVSLLSRQSFKRPLLFAEYISTDVFRGFVVNLIKENPLFEYRLKTENFDLKLKSLKTPLLEGGSGRLNLHSRQTYYYSLTNLEAEGEIYLEGRPVKVSGKAWMDHQWADSPYQKDRWTWFSLQLENNTEIVCFEYGQDKKDILAGVSYPDGRQEHFKKIKISPLGDPWKSPKTGAKYDLSWRIEIPERKMIFEVEPLLRKQEMVFGTLNYWEGPLKVKGKINGRKVRGQGFLELVGRPSQYGTISFLKDVFWKSARQSGLKKFLKKK